MRLDGGYFAVWPQGETQVLWKARGSDKQAKFRAEIAVHIPGLNNPDKPHLFVFPETLVFMNCGNAEFTVPEPVSHAC